MAPLLIMVDCHWECCHPAVHHTEYFCAGKHSGRHALKTRLAQLNYTLTEEQVSDVFRRFKVSSCV